MTAYVTWGFNLPSNHPPPAAKEEKSKTPPPPVKNPKQPTHISFFHLPRWLYRPAKTVIYLALAGLCIAGVVFLTDFFDAKIGHGGFLPHPPVRADEAGAGHGFGVYGSTGNGQHGAVKPEEWCTNHPGDCHWTDSQVRGRGTDPNTYIEPSKLLDSGAGSLLPEWVVPVVGVMGSVLILV